MTDPHWAVERHRAPAADLHALDMPDDGTRRIWLLEPTTSAVVLGSTQAEAEVDAVAAAAAGVEVARRRSGGGAVWVGPDDPIWIDVLVPRHDPLWTDDVGRAFLPVGSAWCSALSVLGMGDLRVHEGPMIRTPWSSTVCFSGTGPGEVLDPSGAKVVGISQRRTRAGARFQCAVYRSWDAEPLRALLATPPPVDALTSAGAGIGQDLSVDEVIAALVAALDTTAQTST